MLWVCMYTILALCTGNAVRSILAEALLAHRGLGRVRAFSAGTNPRGLVSQPVLDAVTRAGLSATGLRSKSLAEFLAPGAPDIDMVLTLCDAAAHERPATWPGDPVILDWPMPEPIARSAEDAALALRVGVEEMTRRVDALLALPLESLDGAEIAASLALQPRVLSDA